MGSTRKAKYMYSGLTVMEMLIVMAVMALAAAASIPYMYATLPPAEVRSAATNTASLFQFARLKAASAQKPVRAVVDCAAHVTGPPTNPCTMRAEIAVFSTTGAFKEWRALPELSRNIPWQVAISSASSASIGGTPANTYWVVYYPSSAAAVSHDPFVLDLNSERTGHPNTLHKWNVSVSKLTGRVVFKEELI